MAYDPFGTLPDPDLLQLGAEANQEFVPAQYGGRTGLVPFAGMQPLVAPQGFGSGLLAGLVSGLGRAGSRQHEAQQKFQTAETQRRATFDQNRLAAQKELRNLTGSERRDALKERAQYERDWTVPTADQLAAQPWIARLPHDANGRVKASDLAAAMKPDKSLSDIRAEAKARAKGTAEGAGDTVPALSAEALSGVADSYVVMGNAAIPPGGRGKERQAFVTKIVNEAYKRNPGGNFAMNQADFKVARQELAKFQTARDLFDTAGAQVDFNVNKAADFLKGLPDAGVTIVNRPLREAANILGSTKYRQFLTYVTAARREYSKITGSMLPGGVGEVPEGARKQMDPILSDDSTVGQIIAAGQAIHDESRQLVGNFDTHIGEIKGRMKVGGPTVTPGQPRTAQPIATHRYNPATGQIEAIGAQR